MTYLQKFDNSNVNNPTMRALAVFEGLETLHPYRIRLKDSGVVDARLRKLPFVTGFERQELMKELVAYRSEARDADNTVPILEWWRNKKAELPNWYALTKRALLIQPSSAGVERVFSVLKRVMSKNSSKKGVLMDKWQIALFKGVNEKDRVQSKHKSLSKHSTVLLSKIHAD
jgi:hypothetical protein